MSSLGKLEYVLLCLIVELKNNGWSKYMYYFSFCIEVHLLMECIALDLLKVILYGINKGRYNRFAATKSTSVNAFVLNGKIPVELKPNLIFFGITAISKHFSVISGIWCKLKITPILLLFQSSCCYAYMVLNGPNTVMSNGCIRCVQCGENDSIVISN